MLYSNSRYLRTVVSTRRGMDTYFLDVRQRFTFNENNCKLYTWVEGDTLDGVSYRFYKNSSFRWAILDANPKYHTEFDIKNGDVILIPSYSEVVGIVNVR